MEWSVDVVDYAFWTVIFSVVYSYIWRKFLNTPNRLVAYAKKINCLTDAILVPFIALGFIVFSLFFVFISLYFGCDKVWGYVFAIGVFMVITPKLVKKIASMKL